MTERPSCSCSTDRLDAATRQVHTLIKAARAAISQIRDDVAFGVIIGSEEARLIYPRTPGLAPASNATRTEAVAAVENEGAGGGTAIGRWLLEACERLAPYERSIRYVILLTDGQDQHETPDELRAAVAACEGVFQCDCRGVGTDWRVDELRWIASALLGTVDIVARPDDMPADFEAMMRRAMGKRIADVRLRLWRPSGARVNFVKQVSPTIEDLTAPASRLTSARSTSRPARGATRFASTTFAMETPATSGGRHDGRAASVWLSTARWFRSRSSRRSGRTTGRRRRYFMSGAARLQGQAGARLPPSAQALEAQADGDVAVLRLPTSGMLRSWRTRAGNTRHPPAC